MMIDFICAFLIVTEIVLTYITVVKLLEIEKKVVVYNEKLVYYGNIITSAHIKITDTIHKINSVVSVFTNKRFIQIKNIISVTIDIIQLVLLVKSLNFSKGVTYNLRNIKKILFTQITREILKKLICKQV